MTMKREPNFNNLLSVLNREAPSRDTLFEFFLNDPLYKHLAGYSDALPTDRVEYLKVIADGFMGAGYDYATITAFNLGIEFKAKEHASKASRSMSETAIITDWKSFEEYVWPDLDKIDYSCLDVIGEHLPAGAKIIVAGPGGVLENVMSLVGYEPMCYMIYEDPELISKVFEKVGSTLVKYYETCGKYKHVGAMISNDDWGFNTQTMLSVADMKQYVFPWHDAIVSAIHGANRPAILHSCGNLSLIMDDIIDGLKYDAKHSYEDNIMPVEAAYDLYGKRIAILGGIDLDFVCRAPLADLKYRCQKMVEKGRAGGYALGTGNSVPEYVPYENYFAMTGVATG